MPRRSGWWRGAYYHNLPELAIRELEKKERQKTKTERLIGMLEEYATYEEAKLHLKEIVEILDVSMSLGYKALKKANFTEKEE